MVFLHGTSIMHGSAAGLPRARRVRQVTSKDRAVLDDGASELARSSGRVVRCVVVPEFGGLAHLPDERTD